MVNIPPLPPQGPLRIDKSKPSSSANPSTEKTTRVSRSIFGSLEEGLTQIKAIFTPSSGKSSLKLSSPAVATSYEQYETYLDNLLLHPVIRNISQEELLNEAVGTETFEQLVDQIIKDLKRNDVIILNGEPLTIKTNDDESIREIKNRLITASSDGRIVGLLHQGIHVSLTITQAHANLGNAALEIIPLDMDKKHQNLLEENSLRKIELTVKGNNKIVLTVSSPINLVKTKNGEPEVLHYISAKVTV